MVRYNNDDRAPLTTLDAATVLEFYTHLPELLRVLRDESAILQVPLAPGDMVILNNHRVMHGREGFDDFGKRCIAGCYAEMDEVDSRHFTG